MVVLSSVQLRVDETVLEGPAVREAPLLPDLGAAQPDAGGQEGNAAFTRCWQEGKAGAIPRGYHLRLFLSVFQAYVNMALFENFTYAGIDATAEEA